MNKENQNNSAYNVKFLKGSNGIEAYGLYIQNIIFTFKENNGKPTNSYSDMGVFLLFEGSQTMSTDNEYAKFIKDGRTTANIIFQSRNAAAKFVAGEKYYTNFWK